MRMESKNYELAYLLSPSLNEEEALTSGEKLTTLIEESKGMIRHAEAPRKRQFAYPVKKQKSGYFGWATFAIAPEYLTALGKKLKNQEGLLRYLMTEEEKVEARPPILRVIPSRPAKPRPVPREAPKPEEKLDLEALDKKLEEILGK